MRAIFATLLASLVVLFALLVLVSEDASRLNSLGLTIHHERVSDVGDLLQAVILQRQGRLDHETLNTIAKA